MLQIALNNVNEPWIMLVFWLLLFNLYRALNKRDFACFTLFAFLNSRFKIILLIINALYSVFSVLKNNLFSLDLATFFLRLKFQNQGV